MPFNRLSTQKVARLVDVHPNTVRLYEANGLIAPAPRTESGYRLFSEMHVLQMRLARTVMGAPWVGRDIRRAGVRSIRLAVAGDLQGAMEMTELHMTLVRQEREQAEAAADTLHRWSQGGEGAGVKSETTLRTGETARLLHLTLDTVRNWERNGLLRVPRDPDNGYRRYSPVEIDRLRIIRMLLRSGYSLMSVHRALSFLDRGQDGDVIAVLDTPMPGEEIYTAADHWLSSLDEQEKRGLRMVEIIKEMKAIS
jgi:DNA-binding transcriptional MerR regulator